VSLTPDQRVIEQLVRRLRGPPPKKAQTNGYGRSTPSQSDEEIISRARAEKNGKFDRLWRGDTSDYGHDHSDADDAFIHKLWSYTQDDEQIRRIHAASGLHRPEKSGRRWDYLQRSLQRARKNVTWFYEWPGEAQLIVNGDPVTSPPSPLPIKGNGGGGDDDVGGAPVVWFSKLDKPHAREFLIEDVLPRNYPAIIHGWSGTAKSILALLLEMAVSGRWERWLGLEVHTHGKVLYLDFELDTDEQLRRVHAIAAGMDVAVPADLAYLSALGMRTPDAFRHAFNICRDHGVVLVVIDSLGPAMLGDMEAARDVIRFHNDYIAPFRAMGVTPLIVDHQGKLQAGENYQQKTAFGSAYKEHLARSVLQVEAGDRDRDNGVLDVRVRHKKSNFGARLDPFDVRLEFGPEKITVTPVELDDADLATETSLNAKDRVVKALQAGPAYPHDLAEMTGLAHGTVVNCLTQLKRAGKVETTDERDGKAEQVRATPSPSDYTRDGDGVDEMDESPTVEQQQEIDRMVYQGWAEHIARRQVLGKGREKP
jgi:hypothetical protein